MATIYDKHIHSFATYAGFHGPTPILLHTGERVWLSGTYRESIFTAADAIQVGDGTSNAFDDEGNCIISVPASGCSFYTEEEAEEIHACMEMDAEILGWANG